MMFMTICSKGMDVTMKDEKDVVYVFRSKDKNRFSIEKHFNLIMKHIDDRIKYGVFFAPYCGNSLMEIVKNILAVRRISSKIIHITGDIHYTAIFKGNRKVVLTIHDINRIDALKGLKKFLYWLLWIYLPCIRADAITTISQESKLKIIQCCRLAETKITIIPAPVDESIAAYQNELIRHDPPNLLMIGTATNKNHIRMLKAIEGMHCLVTIIGKLPEYEIDLLQKLRIEYVNKTNLSDDELYREYSNADVVCFASTSEGFGAVITEAQLLGRPVLTSDIEPMKSVSGGAACLINPFDISSIRNGIQNILEDDGYRKSLCEDGKKNVERFSSSLVAEMHTDIYKKFLMKR